jgi:hypothetical protein
VKTAAQQTFHQMAWHTQRVQAISSRELRMFNKILIANRGENSCAADVSSNGLARAACAGDFTAGAAHV